MAIEDFKDDAGLDPQFWTSSTRSPKAQFRFRVEIEGLELEDARDDNLQNVGGDKFADKSGIGLTGRQIWYLKSCDKPGLDLPDDAKDKSQTGFERAMPIPRVTTPTYKPINMVLIDPQYPNVTRKIARLFRRGGLNDQAARDAIAPLGTIRDFAAEFIETIGEVCIYQMNADGQDIEKWTLYGAYPDKVDFGKFDYSSNDLVEISMTFYYTAFTVEFPSVGGEQYFKYYPDAPTLGQTSLGGPDLTGAELAAAAENKCNKDYNSYVGALNDARNAVTYATFRNEFCRDLLGLNGGSEKGTDTTTSTTPGATNQADAAASSPTNENGQKSEIETEDRLREEDVDATTRAIEQTLENN